MLYAILTYLVPSAIFLYFICHYEGENLPEKFGKLGDNKQND
ncbi:MAG: hypothetical protein ACHQD8_07480 [Chitinophagales bacterium]